MPSKLSHIVALGGGGFSMEDSPNALDNYILSLTGKRKPKVCFIGTASGDSPTYVEKFMNAFDRRLPASTLPLFTRDARNLADFVLAQDVLYVGGGNTANLLQLWRHHGLDAIIRKAFIRGGVVLCGVSAGMNCWHSSCSTDSYGPLAPLTDGLGLVAEAACPHFDGEATRRPTLMKWVAAGKLPTTHAADDFAGFHYTAKSGKVQLTACIKSRLGAGCYRVTRDGKKAAIESLATEMLK